MRSQLLLFILQVPIRAWYDYAQVFEFNSVFLCPLGSSSLSVPGKYKIADNDPEVIEIAYRH